MEKKMEEKFNECISNAVSDFIKKHMSPTVFGVIVSPFQPKILENIRTLYAQGLVSENAIKAALHEVLCREGLRSYHQISASTYPDHTSFPYAIGYAIDHGKIPPKEAKRIRFDHGETLSEYIDESRNLLPTLYKKLMLDEIPEEKPKKAPKMAYSGPFCEEHGI